MDKALEAALKAFLGTHGIEPAEFRDVELYGDTSCCNSSEPTLDLNYSLADKWSRSYELENYELEDFLTFLVNYNGES